MGVRSGRSNTSTLSVGIVLFFVVFFVALRSPLLAVFRHECAFGLVKCPSLLLRAPVAPRSMVMQAVSPRFGTSASTSGYFHGTGHCSWSWRRLAWLLWAHHWGLTLVSFLLLAFLLLFRSWVCLRGGFNLGLWVRGHLLLQTNSFSY